MFRTSIISGPKASQILLLLPAAAVFFLFLAIPVLSVIQESFRTYVPGRIGTMGGGPLTLDNYSDLIGPAYVRYFGQTYLLSFLASAISTIIAFPIAYYIVRNASPKVRKTWMFFLIALMFLSALVRIYAVQLTLGPVGVLAPILSFVGVETNGYIYINTVVVAGLLHYEIPMSVVILIGSVLHLNPRLSEAAQSLGASVFQAHLTITIPLCIKGLVSAFLVSMTVGAAAFAIPWILGRGRILFISNLIYTRLADIGNSPSGAAIAIVMTIASFLLIFTLSRLTSLLDRT